MPLSFGRGRDKGSRHRRDGSNRGWYRLRAVGALKAVQASLESEHTAPQGINGRLVRVKRGSKERRGHLVSRMGAEKSCVNRVGCLAQGAGAEKLVYTVRGMKARKSNR